MDDISIYTVIIKIYKRGNNTSTNTHTKLPSCYIKNQKWRCYNQEFHTSNNSKQTIADCQNSSKIELKNHRNKGKIETLNTHIHDPSLYWRGTGTSIKKVTGYVSHALTYSVDISTITIENMPGGTPWGQIVL